MLLVLGLGLIVIGRQGLRYVHAPEGTMEGMKDADQPATRVGHGIVTWTILYICRFKEYIDVIPD